MINTLARYSLATVLALITTFAVFYAMQSLISASGSVLQEKGFGQLQSFVMDKVDDDLQTKDRKVEKPPEAVVEPPKPDIPKPDFNQTANTEFDLGGFEFDNSLAADAGLAGAASDGEYLPIVKVAPTYPRRAAQRGIEGYVVVEFTVTTMGTVENPRVIEADPANIFDSAALRAVGKFKYKPKMADGKPVAVPGVRNIIRFELDKS